MWALIKKPQQLIGLITTGIQNTTNTVMNLFRSATLTLRSAQLHKMSATPQTAPIESAIRLALTEQLAPLHLEVINESYMHNVPKGSETHFKVLVVSDKFEELSLIKRHRLVNSIVQDKLAGNFVHALSIEAKTPKQWDPNYTVEPSPNCRGGFGK